MVLTMPLTQPTLVLFQSMPLIEEQSNTLSAGTNGHRNGAVSDELSNMPVEPSPAGTNGHLNGSAQLSSDEMPSAAPQVEANGHLDQAIEELKTKFEIFEPDQTLPFLASHPFLITDLKKLDETKRQYFGDAPIVLYHIAEPGFADSESLAAHIDADPLPIKQAREIFSTFCQEWWKTMSREASCLISVGVI